MVEWWRSCRLARDGDQCVKIGYTISHIVYACDVYPLCILFCFDRDGSIIRWFLTLNFKIKCVLPSYAPLQKIVVLKHHVMVGCYKLYVHIQRVQASFAHAKILGLNLTSLAYTDMASEHMDRKVKHESYEWYDQHIDVQFTIKTTSFTWWSVLV
jgi:hypothetical protein